MSVGLLTTKIMYVEMLISVEELSKLNGQDLVSLRCKVCRQFFTRPKNRINDVLRGKYPISLDFCGRACRDKSKETRVMVPCTLCGKPVSRRPCDIKAWKRTYCSKSCAMKDRMQRGEITHKKFKRSKAETYLVRQLRRKFPTLEIRANARDVLPRQLEIDIFIPAAKVAIELNGPTHYRPIFGKEELKKVKNRDAIKVTSLKDAGYHFVVIDISSTSAWKKVTAIINKCCEEIIHPVLEAYLTEVAAEASVR